MRSAAAVRPTLRGALNVIVVLVEFPDMRFTHRPDELDRLFFSTDVIPTGSVNEYYSEASGGLINISGQVVGPYMLPRRMTEYANGAFAQGNESPNARTMALDTASAAARNVDFSQYDNDGNDYVDAFIIVHAGRGAEETHNANDIWSHKWVIEGNDAFNASGKKIYAYLTVPEDCRLGVCAHELGHLLFGWPDLYDLDYSSEGIGNWCLMAGGTWNGREGGVQPGDLPAHPSAWCKAKQGWVNVILQRGNEEATITRVSDSRTVYRLWKDGAETSAEYFLVENRQRVGFDRGLPGDGLLIWHVDDSVPSNTNEDHYRVALTQADGKRDLERAVNRGDGADPYPGTANNTSFGPNTTPSSNSYSGLPTSVAVSAIPPSAANMKVTLQVTSFPRRRAAAHSV
jgi:immune inhibitor A